MATTQRPGERGGPLAGLRVIEVAGLGPVPFGATVLADLGAEVLRVDRPGDIGRTVAELVPTEVLGRSRRSVAVDLKHPDGPQVLLRLAARADVLLEGFRPGVAERLGFGPAACLARNPRLVYARMTGWGQEGPLSTRAGHDIDYVALSGALDPIGPRGGPPVPPLNLVGDFGGGGMLLVVGVLAALWRRQTTGSGEVIDAAMVDGASLLMAMFHGFLAAGGWNEERGTNIVDGGAPFYDVYETADGRHVAVGAIEPQFHAALARLTGLDGAGLPAQWDRSGWEVWRARLAEVFRSRSRDEWCALADETEPDACLAPVLTLSEAPEHPHAVARDAFVQVDGVRQPAPAPRFRDAPAPAPLPPPAVGQDTTTALTDWGFTPEEVADLHASGALHGAGG